MTEPRRAEEQAVTTSLWARADLKGSAVLDERKMTQARGPFLQVLLGLLLPLVLWLVFDRAPDATDLRPSAAFLAVVVILAIFCGPWAALIAAIVSTIALDFLLVDRRWVVVPATWDEALGLAIAFTAAMTVVVLVRQRQRARHRAEENEDRLTETVALLDSMLANSPVGFAFVDLDHRFAVLNQAMADLYRLDPDVVVGRTVGEVFPNPSVEESTTSHVFDNGVAVAAIELVIPGGGSDAEGAGRADRHALGSYFPVWGSSGELLGVGMTIVDVSERNEMQRMLLDVQEQFAEDRFRRALDSLPDFVAIQRSVRDGEGRTIDFVMEFVNHPDLPVGDMLRHELVGRRLLETLPGFAESDVFAAMVTVADTHQPATVEDRPVTVLATGETEPRYATVQIAPFGDGVIAVVRDVSERQRQLRRIEQANDELSAAQELAHIGVWRVDLDRGQMTLSEEAARIIGSERSGVVPWVPGVLLDLIDEDDRERVIALLSSTKDGSFLTETDIRRPDGQVRRVSLVGQFIAPDEEQEATVWGTVQDVTEQRIAEQALRDARARLEQERATVLQLQQVMVPTLPDDEIEVGATYRAAGDTTLVGGDWYDAFGVDQGRIVLAVGDVAGHGLAAAALMSQLRNAVRGLSFADHGPDEVVVALNRLIAMTGSDELATCIIGSFDRQQARLAWASAGHPPALILRPGEAPGYLEGSVAPPIGFPGVSCDVNEVDLEPGTILVLYSDGLIERRGESLDVGLDRLTQVAASLADRRPQELCEDLAEAMLAGTDQRDDVCVLAFRVPDTRRS